MRHHELTNEEWAIIAPLLPNNRSCQSARKPAPPSAPNIDPGLEH